MLRKTHPLHGCLPRSLHLRHYHPSPELGQSHPQGGRSGKYCQSQIDTIVNSQVALLLDGGSREIEQDFLLRFLYIEDLQIRANSGQMRGKLKYCYSPWLASLVVRQRSRQSVSRMSNATCSLLGLCAPSREYLLSSMSFHVKAAKGDDSRPKWT